MKKLGFAFALLICYGVINGFCGGGQAVIDLEEKSKVHDNAINEINSKLDVIGNPQQAINALRESIGGLQGNLDRQQGTIGSDLQGKFDNQEKTLGEQLVKLDNQEKAIGEQLIKLDNQEKAIGEQLIKLDNQEKAIVAISEQLIEIRNQLTGIGGQQGLSVVPGGTSNPVWTNLFEPEQSLFYNAQAAQGQSTQAYDNSQDRLVPLTKELINTVTGYGQNLYSLGYYLSATLTLVTNSESTGYINQTGVFVLNEGNAIKEVIKINFNEKGRLENYNDRGKEIFEISFPDKTVRLTFERNEKKNSYDLVSADDAGKRYTININEGEPIPQLFIRFNHISDPNPTIKVQSVPTSQTAESERRIDDPNRVLGNLQFENALLQQREPIPTIPVLPPSFPWEMTNARNISIEGTGWLTRNDIVRYIKGYNPNPPQYMESLIDTYIWEADREGINHDIAVAQMCYATNYLKERQLINVYNYAGFSAVNRVPVTYRNMNDGIRAHIQHLKGYASHQLPKGNIIDQRYQILVTEGIQGTVKTLDALFVRWSPTNYQQYGNGIVNILKELYLVGGYY
jgi:hypothetical protein